MIQRYSQAAVVFDGYEEGPSIKDCVHQRRSGVSGPSVNFDSDMVLNLKKDVFLSNTANKQRLIKLLAEKLQLSGRNIIHASGDAGLMIVQMAVQFAKSITTFLVGDDTKLLVCFASMLIQALVICFSFLSQAKVNDAKDLETTERDWDQKPAQILFLFTQF